MATKGIFTNEDVEQFLAIKPEVEESFSDDEVKGFLSTTGSTPEVDYVRSASQAVKPKYDYAINAINSFFDSGVSTNTPENKKLKLKEKAAMIGMPEADLKGIDEKGVDRLLFRKRAKDAAAMYPDYVSKADTKSLEQLFTNPEAVKKINNAAKARAMKATTFEKFVATNKASMLSMANTIKFLGTDSDFEEWAMTAQLIDSERKATSAKTKGTDKLNKMWDDYTPFDSSSQVSFKDLLKYMSTDSEGFKAAFAEASNSAASIATSIAGSAAGAAVGVVGGPVGVAAGMVVGGFSGGAVAAFDEYIQNELDNNFRDTEGNIRWDAVRANIGPLKNKWRIEAAEQGLISGAAEAFAPKILSGLGKAVARAVPSTVTKMFKPYISKSLVKAGKLTGEVAGKGVKEFVGEGASATVPKTLIDFQNGRLDKAKLLSNVKEGAREGVSGLITAGSLAPVSITIEKAASKVASNTKAKSETTEVPPPQKPFNEQTTEEKADTEYQTKQAEDTLETVDGMDEDADTLDSIEGMTDFEKVSLIDSANTETTITEDGVVFEGTPTEAVVNGTDLETLLGPDISLVKEVLSDERKTALAEAVSAGEDFKFTYGEWIVAANKLKEKHPTINHIVQNPETTMAGYEAVDHLSGQLEIMQSQYEKLSTRPFIETPPATPGISAEISGAEITSREQTGIVRKVNPTKNINEVSIELADGSTHLITLYNKETALEIQRIADTLAKQFEKALKASGTTSEIVAQASLQGIPVMMRVLVKRAKALGKSIEDMAKSISFKSDMSHSSAYIGVRSLDSGVVTYGVGRSAQRVSTVAHEFAHAILHFMTVDSNELEAQSQAGTLNAEGIEYLDVIRSTAKLLELNNISEVNTITATTLTDPKTGKVITKNQSRQPLTMRTVVHEKMATTMEVFLKAGKLETDAMDTEIAKILLYWRSLIPSEVLSRQASVAAVEGWTYAGEYHQALDPTDEVGRVFHSMYSVNQQIATTAVPMFNFNFFPIEILGKGGKLILDKIIEVKHTAIAKVFAKMYADSINARTALNTPEVIAKMNKALHDAFAATYSGELMSYLNALGLRIPESLSKELRAIQDMSQKFATDKAEFTRDATDDDITVLLEDNPDAFDVGDSPQVAIGRMVEAFNQAKATVYEDTLSELGYVNDARIKEAAEEMLAKSLPSILNDQFAQLVAKYPNEAKELFSAYMKNGEVSSRVASKQITVAAEVAINNMSIKDVRINVLIKKVRDASMNVVNSFNQGSFIDALVSKFDEITKSEMLRLAPAIINKIESAAKALKTYGSLAYVRANEGNVHPETMQYLRNVLNALAANVPVTYTIIENLDPALDAFVEGITRDMVNSISGKKLDSVGVFLQLGDYTKLMAKVAAAASELEKEARELVTTTKVNQAKVRVLGSKKVWDMRSFLPQANSIHEVFSTYFPSEEVYRDSAIFNMIYNITNGEADSTNEAEAVIARIKVIAEKSLSKKLEPTRLTRTGLLVSSRDELIGVLLYMGSESGMETLLRTHGLVKLDPNTNTNILMGPELQEDIEDLVNSGVLTEDDINLANTIWAEFVTLLNMIQDVYRRDRGIKVGEIKAVPFTVGKHILNGGYFPITYNEIMSIGEGTKAESMFYNLFSLKSFRRTKERGGGKRTPVKLSLTPITSYVNMVHREFHIKPAVQILKSFVNDPEVTEHLKTTRPGALEEAVKAGVNTHQVGIINDWIDTVENQVRGDVDPNTPKFVNMLLRNTSFVFYSMDAVAGITNTIAGLPAAIPYTSSKMRLAMNAMLWPLKIKTFNKRASLSSQLRANEKQLVNFILSEHTEELYSNKTKAKEFINKAAMTAQRVSQYVLETIIWNTEFEAQTAKGASQTEAIKQADAVAERVLGRYAMSNRSIGQKGGALGRLTHIASQHLISFKRQFNVELKRDSNAWRKAYMTSMVTGAALLSTKIALEIWDWSMPDDPREEEEDKELKMKVQLGTEMLPYFLGVYGRILATSINSGMGSDLSITPVESSIKKTLRAIPKMAVAIGTDYSAGARDWADMFAAATMVTGIPFSGIANVNDFITAFRNHDEMAYERLMEDAERQAYTQEFNQEYNPLID